MSVGKGIYFQGFDFHCHVDLHSNPIDLIQECEKNGIAVLAVTTTPKAWAQNRRWTDESRHVYCAVGLHPELVGDRFEEIALLEDYMEQTRLVGEIGLDGSPHNSTSWDRQLEVFSRALKRANDLGNRVLSIHSRRAANQVVDMIARHTAVDRVLPILHWYSGSKTTAEKALDYGCFFSVNLRMLANERGRELIEFLPKDKLLIETDAPFTSVDDCKYSPELTIETAEQAAHLKETSIEEFNKQLQANARYVFNFAGIDLGKIVTN